MPERNGQKPGTDAAGTLADRIAALLEQQPQQKANDIARLLGADRREVNRCLYHDLAGQVIQDASYRWSLSSHELRSMQEEADSIARDIQQRRKAGAALSDIGVFYTAPFVGTAVAESLERAGIAFEWLKDAKSKQWLPGHDSVKLMTMHSSKGLQYSVCIIAGAGCLPYMSKDDDARLMYVAMTRATHELMITGSRRTVFTERLKEICQIRAA